MWQEAAEDLRDATHRIDRASRMEIDLSQARLGAIAPILMERVLAEAPFGIRIMLPNGTAIYDNGVRLSGSDEANDSSRAGKVGVRRFPVRFDNADLEVVLTLDETEQFIREQDLFRRAFFDELTKLPNRAMFERSLSNAIGQEDVQPFALAFFDLNDFKVVNDSFGHDVGDQLLSWVARRLQSSLRPTDMPARLGGDEFALLLSPVADAAELRRDVEWLSDRLMEPMCIEGHEIVISASIGVSLFPKDGDNIETLRANADRAMYRAKSRKEGGVVFFDKGIEHALIERNRAEQRLRLAISDRRVCCAYQPKVELRSGDVVGVEVLMRWWDEKGALQTPGHVLETAAELDLMEELTIFLLEEVMDSIDLINEAFSPDCSISINIAAKQAGDVRFMRQIISLLEQSGQAARFMLELTEEAFISKSEFQQRVLPMIRRVGARVSIDDFGTGYSSLSALAEITADEVKIDRSFITDVHKRPRSQAVLKAVEALAHSLGMSIIVEGVESFEELGYLQAATGIRYAQGFYFAKPMLLTRRGSDCTVMKTGRELAVTRSVQSARR